MATKVLVTGGTGYIGSHTVVALIEEGFETIVIDDLSNSSAEVIDNIEKITRVRPHFEQLDISDADKTNAFFKKHSGINAIIHFAAYKAVGESVKEPLKYYHNNLVSLINLLNCQLQYSINNLVFSSSCTVYGQPDVLPVTEQTPRKDAESPYGNTKRISEDIIYDTLKVNPALNSILLRYFNPIGAHPSALIGELPLGVPQNLVPFITQSAAGVRGPLSVFGNDYNTPDGSAIRDYINVVDLAKAHVLAIDRLLEGKNRSNYEIFNLGTGTGFSVLEVVNAFIKSTGVNLNYKIVDRRPGDVEQIWADTTLANTDMGWKAETSIEETLLSAWLWEKHLRGIK